MTRIVNIAGAEIKIETGKVPAPRPIIGRGKGPFRLLLEEMQTGESVTFPYKYVNMRSNTLTTVGKAIGKKFIFRREGENARIFCMPAEPVKRESRASRSNGAAFPFSHAA